MYAMVVALFAGVTALAGEGGASFEIDALSPGRVLPNVQKRLVKWQLKDGDFAAVERNAEFDGLEFAEYVEIVVFLELLLAEMRISPPHD